MVSGPADLSQSTYVYPEYEVIRLNLSAYGCSLVSASTGKPTVELRFRFGLVTGGMQAVLFVFSRPGWNDVNVSDFRRFH